MTRPTGFKHDGETIFYIDACGKDASFERWRAYLYYQGHWAKTVFFPSELAYEVFLAARQPLCYPDYAAFRNAGRMLAFRTQSEPV